MPRAAAARCRRGRRRQEDARKWTSLHPAVVGQRPSLAWTISTCCSLDGDEPRCWEAHATKMGWRERRDFPIDRATGNVVETEEASDENSTRVRRTDLAGLEGAHERRR